MSNETWKPILKFDQLICMSIPICPTMECSKYKMRKTNEQKEEASIKLELPQVISRTVADQKKNENNSTTLQSTQPHSKLKSSKISVDNFAPNTAIMDVYNATQKNTLNIQFPQAISK